MIIDFSFKNYKSFKDAQSFSMRRDMSLDFEKESITSTKGENINRISAIYGANAAGKSNFLTALLALRRLVSLGKIEDNNFAGGSEQETLFRLIFEYKEKKYDYSISAQPQMVSYEKLSIYYTNQPTLIYEYVAKPRRLKIGNGMIRGDEETAVNYNSEKEPSRPILHFLKESDNVDIKNAFHFFVSGIIPQSMLRGADVSETESKLRKIFEQDTPDGKFFNRVIPTADLGIKGVTLVDDESNLNVDQMNVIADAIIKINELGNNKMSDEEEKKLKGLIHQTVKRISFIHRIGNETLSLKLEDESNGTVAASNIFTDLRKVLKNGVVYIVDEIDRSLHPSLVVQLIDIFNSSETNPHGAQLIFTTHDVSILDPSIYGRSILDRDQVWFVEKGNSGESSLYPLTQIKGTRKEDNLYRKYISGRYGATPKVSLFYEIQKYWESLSNE